MKIIYLILCVMFLVFAGLQLNDPDPIHWVLAYLAIAISCALVAFGKYPKWWLWGVTIVFGVWMLIASPAFFRWVQEGFPNIAGQMEDSRPIIEETREFLGLLIAFIVMLTLALPKRTVRS
ncbi:MAG: transmembrane 220 family protein [Flavobacteriales bacterium]|nr:transmembrane 220 family protein [Flavobacteriales bacterium]